MFRENDNRRVDPDEKYLQYKQVTDAQHQILRLKVLGYTNQQIARQLRITTQTVSNVVNSKIHRNQLEVLQEAANSETIDIAHRIAAIGPKAVEVLQGLVEGRLDSEIVDQKLRYKAAVDVLAIAGHGKVSRVKSEGVVAHLTSDDVRELVERGKQIREAELVKVLNG